MGGLGRCERERFEVGRALEGKVEDGRAVTVVGGSDGGVGGSDGDFEGVGERGAAVGYADGVVQARHVALGGDEGDGDFAWSGTRYRTW